MKNKTQVMLNTLLAILSIVLLIIGVSEGVWLLIILGVVCFLAILIIRARQIRKMNKELNNMQENIPDEIDDPENK